MNSALFNILRYALKQLARLTIWRFRPGIVGITGSVGKTSAKRATLAVLGSDRKVRAGKGNLNNDLGLPLAVLGDWKEKDLKLVSRGGPEGKRARKLFFWIKVIFISFFKIAFGRASAYPEILILEYGADRPGDLKYLLRVARPNVSVITAVGEVPVHVEFFSGPGEVAREKARLIEYLPTAGFAILNYDDDIVMELRDRTRAHVTTFGFGKGAEIQIISFENRVVNGAPVGIAFKLEHGGNSVPVRLDGVFGKTHAYASAAAAAVGIVFGMNLVKISEALGSYRPAEGRMSMIPGIKSSNILDDSYNASPLSMHAALDTLKSLPAKRKVAVLGDMLEIGKYAIEAHEKVGRLAAKCADVLITVGPRGKLIAESSREAGLARKYISSFDVVDDALEPVLQTLRKGDLVLVKASRGIGLDKIVEAIKIP